MMKKRIRDILLFSTTFLNCYVCNSQEICISIDSLTITALPWNLETRMALNDYQIRNFEPVEYRAKRSVTDEKSVSALLEIIQDTLHTQDSISSIDPRMVIDFYHNGVIFSTLMIDNRGSWEFYQVAHSRNRQLMIWLVDNYGSSPR